MIHSLVLRLVAARGADEQIDTALLTWAEAAIGFTDAEYLRHCCGLTGDLSGAARFAAWAMPDTVFTFEWDPGACRASATAHVGDVPRPVAARDLANAILAATLAAFAQGAVSAANDADTTPIALTRRA